MRENGKRIFLNPKNAIPRASNIVMLRTDKSNQKMWLPLMAASRKFRIGAKVKSLALVLFAVFVVADINVLADNKREGIKQGNATYYGNR